MHGKALYYLASYYYNGSYITGGTSGKAFCTYLPSMTQEDLARRMNNVVYA